MVRWSLQEPTYSIKKNQSAPFVIRKESAISNKMKSASLSDEALKRMKNTSLYNIYKTRVEILNVYDQMLQKSG